ncbi:MAG: ABC transporter ATP-binding protein [Clostridia bacterium]|nr:ABC transporter ATP-binding protein [Clostridia bacterium]
MKNVRNKPNFENITDYNITVFEDDFLRWHKSSAENGSFFKNVFYLCKGHYRDIVITVIFCTLQLSVLLFLPIATANIINALVDNQPNKFDLIILNAGIAGFLLAINFPLQMIYQRRLDYLTRSIEAKLRGSIVRKLQRLNIAFSKQMPSGKIQSKLMRDVDSIRASIIHVIRWGTHIVVNLVTIITVILVKGCWQLLVFFACCVPILVLISSLRKGMREKNRAYRIEMEKTTSKVVDMVDLIPVTKAHSVEDYEIKKMSNLLNRTAKSGYEIDYANSKFNTAVWLVVQCINVLCLLFIVFMAYKGYIKIGDITLYQTYFSRLLDNANSVLSFLPAILAGAEAINSIAEILKSDQVENNENKITLKDLRGEYIFEDIGFKYDDDDHTILNGLSLKVNPGETVAFVGESGSGKSTAINLVTGFYFPTLGTLKIDGVSIKDIDLHSYRQHIAVVPQNSVLFSGTVRENITYGLPNTNEEFLQKIIDLACLRDVIDNLPNGLDTYVGEHGYNLSGGQRQRISIARALIRNPKVIIFDEATSALDTVSEKHIQTAIENLSKDKTTFIVAHRLSTIKNADKIAVIDKGKCVEFGTYDELIAKKGAFYKFRQLQI